MSPAEKLFYPIYLFLTAVGYLRFFLCMLPAGTISAALGVFSGIAVWTHGRNRLKKLGLHRYAALLLLWEVLALAAAAWLGGAWGYFVVGARKGRRMGMCVTIFLYLAGDLLSIWLKRNKEV